MKIFIFFKKNLILKFFQILEIFKFCENFQIYEIIWNSMKTEFFDFLKNFRVFVN